MPLLNRIAAEVQTRLTLMTQDRERGQGTLEYVGIAVLIGVIMVAIFGIGLDDKIKETITSTYAKITAG